MLAMMHTERKILPKPFSFTRKESKLNARIKNLFPSCTTTDRQYTFIKVNKCLRISNTLVDPCTLIPFTEARHSERNLGLPLSCLSS